MSIGDKWFSPQIAQGGDTPQSRVYCQLTNWLAVVCIIFLTVNSARIVYRSIYSELAFFDEYAYTRSIYNLILSLTPAGAEISGVERYVGGSGIIGSGIGAAIFFFGGDLLHSRITVAVLGTLIAVLIGFSLFRRWSFGPLHSSLGATLIWGLTVTTPFALPYWHGFIFNLGELPGALGLGIGLLVGAAVLGPVCIYGHSSMLSCKCVFNVMNNACMFGSLVVVYVFHPAVVDCRSVCIFSRWVVVFSLVVSRALGF